MPDSSWKLKEILENMSENEPRSKHPQGSRQQDRTDGGLAGYCHCDELL